MQASSRSTLAGISFLGLSIILFEIALTRVFAIMMWHHFTYMVISIGLLGFGASGSLMTATRLAQRLESPAKALTWISIGYGVSVMLAFCFATLVRIDSLAIWQAKENFIALFFVYLIVGVPFLLGGMGIGLALTRYVKNVNRLYFGDLVGSAIGAGLSVLLMRNFGSSATVIMAGGFGLVAAFCFGLGAPRRYLVLTLPGLAFALVTAIGFAGGGLGIPALTWRVPFAPGKEALAIETRIEQMKSVGAVGLEIDRIYSATAEVQVGPDWPSPPGIGGDKGLLDDRNVSARSVGQDGTAPTWLFANAADLSQFPFLDDMQPATAYVAHRAAGREDQDVMVIGVGGGIDVMMALVSGARHVTAVELNTAMIEMVTERYDDYLGGLFRPGAHEFSDRIELVNGEGRAWLRSHDDTYDVIQMSGVDSYTALSTGAYTLSESYLYTTGAVADFYEHLNDNGIVNWSRFIENAPMKPRETLRLANIACTALRELGVEDAGAHVAVFQGQAWASTMMKKGAFTAVEVDALREFAAQQGFVGLVYDPLQPTETQLELHATHFARLRGTFLDGMQRAGVLPKAPEERNAAVFGMQQVALQIAAGAEPDEGSLPEVLRGPDMGPRILEVLKKPHLRAAINSQATYLRGAMRDFSTLLRGTDREREQFIADYDFDVSPATDDKPFFFNYYRWSSLFGGGARTYDPKAFTYHTDFPVGHMILLASLLQIMLLAAALIFLPIRKLAREGARVEGSWRYFAYFAALGLGFMLLEIALMQKLVIFLGHPTYALSVVLTSLLASAGLGSLLAGRIRIVRTLHLRLVMVGILAVVLGNAYAVNNVLPELLGQSLELRVLVVVAMLLPTGLVLGIPFPSGMRIVEAHCPQLLPWGWAINAFFSVFGSIFCIILSMWIGFTNVLFAAGGVYLLGMMCMRQPADPGEQVEGDGATPDPTSEEPALT